jgi:hypothetical protein
MLEEAGLVEDDDRSDRRARHAFEISVRILLYSGMTLNISANIYLQPLRSQYCLLIFLAVMS